MISIFNIFIGGNSSKSCTSMNLYSPCALTGVRCGREEDCQSLRGLSRMDDNSTDISGTRGTGHQNAIGPQFEVWAFVCIVDILDDLLWGKHDHELMRKECDRVHLQFEVGEHYGTGFGHTHRRPQYANVDCARLRPVVEACRFDRSGIFRDRRTDDLGIRKFGPEERIEVWHMVSDNDARHASDDWENVATRSAGLFVWK